MSVRIPIADLNVIGYIGRALLQEAPRRLMPVYQSRAAEHVLVPPSRDDGVQIEGPGISPLHLEDLVEEAEVTRLETSVAASAGHILWMSHAGPRYQAASEAERELDTWAVHAVEEVCVRRLDAEGVRDLLFGVLRVRPTVMANALLAVHFQLTGETRLARPIRDDLAALVGRPTGVQDQRFLEAVGPLLSSSADLATAVAMEVRRAGRRDLVDQILKTVPVTARSASGR